MISSVRRYVNEILLTRLHQTIWRRQTPKFQGNSVLFLPKVYLQ